MRQQEKRVCSSFRASPAVLPVLAVLLCLVFGWSGSLVAQGTRWDERNDRGNRYEGRREIPVGSPDLELISFARIPDFEEDSTLWVSFFLPEDVTAAVVARELRDRKKYWMKSKPLSLETDQWNDFGPWPTADVLDREGIPSWNLGVVVELTTEAQDQTGRPKVAPAVIVASQQAPESRSTIDSYAVHLLPGVPLKRLRCSVRKLGAETGESLLTRQRIGTMREDEPIEIELDASALPTGWLLFEATGSVRGSTEKASFELEFFHRGG